MNLPAAYGWPAERVRAWTTALDAFAAAGRAAAAATATGDLLAGIAHALAGRFADWVIIDDGARGPASRLVAARRRQPVLADALAGLSGQSCPMIASAMSQRTPLVRATPDDPVELGVLPDGRPVAGVLRASSYAVSPLTVDREAIGAITIIRGEAEPHVTFLELSVLAHVADLTATAIRRLGDAGPRAGSRRRNQQ